MQPPRGTGMSSRRGVRTGRPGVWTKVGGRAARGNGQPAGDRGEARSSVPNEQRHFPALATLSRPNGGAIDARPGGDTLSLPAIDGRAAVDAPPGGLRAPPARQPARSPAPPGQAWAQPGAYQGPSAAW